VLLGEVAEVREVSSDLAGISRTDGEPSLGLNITKAADANTVEVADGVVGALNEARDELGEDEVRVVFNSAEDVRESVSGLVQEGAIGAVLAIAVIFAFLRSMRATLVTAVSLPTSVLAALLFSWGYDLTLNILTLAGLTIAVGRVVDDAIVVLENSYRYVQQGYDPETAALKGTTEVASAITSSTLTTTAVFVPLAVVGGIVSKFFVPLSLTVALALLASLIVAVTVIPVLVSVFIKRQVALEEAPAGYPGDEPVPDSRRGARREAENGGEPRSWEPAALVVLLLVVGVVIAMGWTGLLDGVSGAVSDAWSNIDFGSPAVLITLGVAGGVFGTLAVLGIVVLAAREARRPPRWEEEGSLVRMYTPMLRWALRHRPAVLILAALVFAGGVATAFFLPVSFFPPSEERLAIARIELPAGTGLQQTDREVGPFEDFLLDDGGVESYQISLGGEDNFDPNSPIRSDNQAQAFVTIAEDADPGVVVDRISDRGRELYGEGGFQAEILSNGPPQGELQATITGGTEGERREAADLVSEELSGIGSVTNVRSDVAGGAEEIAIEVDPERAAATGLSPEAVAGALATLVGEGAGATLGETPVSVGVPDEAADSVEEIGALPLAPGRAVGDVADVREVEAPTARSRVDGEPAVQVTGRITGQDTQSVSAEAQEALADLNLPGDAEATVGGENEDIEESFRNLFLSIIVALALVFLILVVFFGSLLVPLVILLAVPLTTVGAFGGLYVTNTALSLPSLLGILLLIGIVVSNAILLVDFAIKARDDHETADEAVMAAGRARLRPILMTALATIFALLPLALGLAGGGNGLISSSLAITVIGGLATSTFLTLLVVPVGYSVLESVRSRRKKKGYSG
jgi:HAE1 family hydrophobic/amphiphilic exporter-1